MAKKKAASKGGGKKKATGTAVAKKGTGKAKTTAVEVEATPMTDEETALIDVGELGIKPFGDPSKLTTADLENKAIDLVQARSQNEAELSAILYYINKKQVHVDHGWDPKEYFEKRLGIGHSRAMELSATWEALVVLGIDNITLLTSISWDKFKLLKPAINAGKINKRNHKGWLKKCDLEKGLLLPDLQKEVKGLIADSARAGMDESLKNVSFKIPAYDLKTVETFEKVAREMNKTGDRGSWFLQALIEYSSAHADQLDARRWKAIGLATLKELAERTAPVVCVFIPTSKEIADKQLGVAPVRKVYQGYGREGDQKIRHCIASSASEAKKFLGVENVRDFELEVTPSLQPKNPFITLDDLEETPPAKPEAKPEKAAPKKKAAAKKKGKKGKKEAWEIDDDAVVKEKIRELVGEQKIKRDEYEAKKKEIRKDLPEGLTMNQAILKWLTENSSK